MGENRLRVRFDVMVPEKAPGIIYFVEPFEALIFQRFFHAIGDSRVLRVLPCLRL